MSAWVTSVVIPIGVSMATTLVVGLTFGPRLAARNKRVQAAHDDRDQFNDRVVDILALCSNLQTVTVSEDLPEDLRMKVEIERARWVGQIDETTIWLVDHWQRFALTYAGTAGVRSMASEYVMAARGVWLSDRSLADRVRLLKELTEPIQAIYFAYRWRAVRRVVRERAWFRKVIDSLAEDVRQSVPSADPAVQELPGSQASVEQGQGT